MASLRSLRNRKPSQSKSTASEAPKPGADDGKPLKTKNDTSKQIESRELNFSALNKVMILKEVFLSILNAAVLEPIIALAGANELSMEEIAMNVFTLCSIVYWTYMLTDAFDFQDVMQYYKYHYEFEVKSAENEKKDFLKPMDEGGHIVRSKNRRKDYNPTVLLNVLTIALPWLPDYFGMGDAPTNSAVHAIVITVFWLIFHHYVRRATKWEDNYLLSLLFPARSLMPMEYCVPLMDVADTVEDVEFLENYVKFVKDQTDVSMVLVC